MGNGNDADRVAQLEERVRSLEAQLGYLREPDGRYVVMGVTATRVAELRALVDGLPIGDPLADAVRFYDMVRSAWEGTIQEYNEQQERVDTAITWLVTVTKDQPASIIADRAKLALNALRDASGA